MRYLRYTIRGSFQMLNLASVDSMWVIYFTQEEGWTGQTKHPNVCPPSSVLSQELMSSWVGSLYVARSLLAWWHIYGASGKFA